MFKVYINLIYGIYKVAQLQRSPITIFGGTHLKPESIYMKKAAQLARMLAENNVPVLTGGGPGIMEAANCGALEVEGPLITSIGISVKGLDREAGESACKREVILMDNFSVRKWLLTRYSIGFAVFPGGFGTVDELAEVLTLIQTEKREKSPIVLIGKDYWKPFLEWINESALKCGLVSEKDLQLFSVTDDIDEACALLLKDQLLS